MLIDLDTPIDLLEQSLQDLGWIEKERVLDISSAGEGNMNVVLRIKTTERSFILKQSRPYVQKYPSIPAPIERINVEVKFYKSLDNSQISTYLPDVLHYAPEHHLLMMKDLGDIKDMTSIYGTRSIEDITLKALVDIAYHTHTASLGMDFPPNLELRQLNHQHIFVLPYSSDNGFSLDDVQAGLQDLAKPYQDNQTLNSAIKEVGDKYMSDGSILIHGDYYPGSWMMSGKQIYVLDPEFAHLGYAEFDIGVMSAHIIIATHDPSYLDKIIALYAGELQTSDLRRMTGIEIFRRLIGLAQLPLTRSLEEKKELLDIAKQLVLS